MTNAWLRSHLSNRYQRVLINNSSSNNTTFLEWGKIKHDVPQGSILGPLFFLIYITDLPTVIANPLEPVLFADTQTELLLILVPQNVYNILTT
jgi:hypothetical protein